MLRDHFAEDIEGQDMNELLAALGEKAQGLYLSHGRGVVKVQLRRGQVADVSYLAPAAVRGLSASLRQQLILLLETYDPASQAVFVLYQDSKSAEVVLHQFDSWPGVGEGKMQTIACKDGAWQAHIFDAYNTPVPYELYFRVAHRDLQRCEQLRISIQPDTTDYTIVECAILDNGTIETAMWAPAMVRSDPRSKTLTVYLLSHIVIEQSTGKVTFPLPD